MTPKELAKSGSEHAQQRALFAWSNMACRYGKYIANYYNEFGAMPPGFDKDNPNQYLDKPIPELKWLHAIHNQGHGDKIRGAIAKAEGVKTGIWDIFLPVVRSRKPEYNPTPLTYNGLYIEMKVGNNKLTKEQIEFQTFGEIQGYKFVVCYTWEDARDAIIKYLGLN